MATEVLEVAFKAGRIGIYANPTGIEVEPEEFVQVEADRGTDVGKVLRKGEDFAYNGGADQEQLKKVTRRATRDDTDKVYKNRRLEEKAIRSCKDKIERHGLNMNLVDAEYQWDHAKLTFYFTSDERVDFRALVRDLASQYRTRIELRQIGVRDAARHTGGYETCGCQLCCTVFLRKFENITTQYIRDQLIPTNPSRLTGVCGRLKCCLAFERDFYIDELNKYPRVNSQVTTPAGKGRVAKIDIFNGVVYVKLKNRDIEKFPPSKLEVV